MILKEPLIKNLATVGQKKTKEFLTEGYNIKKWDKSQQRPEQDLTEVSRPSVDLPFMTNALSGGLAIMGSFIKKGNRDKMLRYAKLHMNWSANQ